MNMLATIEVKPKLVLLHGWGFDRSVFTPWQAQLERFFDVDYADLPGYGDAAANLEAWCADLAAMLSQPTVLLGWSLGGQAAVHFAHRFPAKVSALINVAGNPSFVQRDAWLNAMPMQTFNDFEQNFASNPRRTLRRFTSLVAQDADNARRLQKLLHDPAPAVQVQQQGLSFLRHWDVRTALSRLPMPVLHLLGERDQLVPATLAESLRALAPAQQVCSLRGAGHAVFLHNGAGLAKQIHQFVAAGGAAGVSKSRVADSFSNAAAGYDAVAHLQRRVADHLFASLPAERRVAVLDLGCGTGSALPRLRSRFPAAAIVAIDIAQGMLQFAKRRQTAVDCTLLCADAETLPLADQSIDCIFSNLVVQWCDFNQVMSECRRVLKPGGTLRLSTLGSATLHELRTAWSQADNYVHVNRFMAIDDVRGALACSGLHDWVVKREMITLQYPDVRSLTGELKALGAHNMNHGAPGGLTGKQRVRAMLAAYEQQRDAEGKLPASYEALYVSAEKSID